MISSCPSGRAFAPRCGPPPLPTPPTGDVGGGVPSLDLPPAPAVEGGAAPSGPTDPAPSAGTVPPPATGGGSRSTAA
ncbi:MAG: hypothetical protein JNM10_19395 [Planctomycetia bacterium]|nr:hypothetical protein [Planctomycetia bacterium]